jgi:hypothetical protein
VALLPLRCALAKRSYTPASGLWARGGVDGGEHGACRARSHGGMTHENQSANCSMYSMWRLWRLKYASSSPVVGAGGPLLGGPRLGGGGGLGVGVLGAAALWLQLATDATDSNVERTGREHHLGGLSEHSPDQATTGDDWSIGFGDVVAGPPRPTPPPRLPRPAASAGPVASAAREPVPPVAPRRQGSPRPGPAAHTAGCCP